MREFLFIFYLNKLFIFFHKRVVIKICSQQNGIIVTEKEYQSNVIFNDGCERIYVALES